MLFTKSVAAAAVLASGLLAEGVSAKYVSYFKNNTVLYWGQNGNGGQSDLLTTCSDPNIDVVVMGFVTTFKGNSSYPILNLADQCGNTFPSRYDSTGKTKTDILNCPDVGTKITQCQKLGKKILISLGGRSLKSGFKDAAAARDAATRVWEMFGGEVNKPYRPFGPAVVDGFDMDFEDAKTRAYAVDFAKQLKLSFDKDPAKKAYMLTAAPQCHNPDAALNDAILQVPFDVLFIQFYNNPCAANTFQGSKSQDSSNSFNLGQWQTWAAKAANPKVKLFVGLIASSLAGTGYVPMTKAQDIVRASKKYPNFAGVMLWDASFLRTNRAYLTGIKSALNESPTRKRSVEPGMESAEKAEAGAFINKIRRRQHHHRG